MSWFAEIKLTCFIAIASLFEWRWKEENRISERRLRNCLSYPQMRSSLYMRPSSPWLQCKMPWQKIRWGRLKTSSMDGGERRTLQQVKVFISLKEHRLNLFLVPAHENVGYPSPLNSIKRRTTLRIRAWHENSLDQFCALLNLIYVMADENMNSLLVIITGCQQRVLD